MVKEGISSQRPLFTGPTAEKEYLYIKDTAALFMERVMAGKIRPSDLAQDAQTYLLAPMIAIAEDLKQRFDNHTDMELPPEAGDLPETEGITRHHMITGLDHYEFIENPDNYQTSDNRRRFNLLKDFYQKYDSVLATTLPDSREELEEDLVTRLKTWVGTQQDFFATASNLVRKITKTQPDLIGKYFPQPSESQETVAPPIQPDLIGNHVLGIHLPNGIRGDVGKNGFAMTPLTCVAQGCIATVPLDAGMLEALKAGRVLNLELYGNAGRQQVKVAGSLKGITNGLRASGLD